MMRNIRIGLFLLGLALLSSFSGRAAFAQVACPILAPVTVTGTTYTFSANDGCKVLIFSAAGAVTITVPNAAVTVNPGWQVFVKSIGAGGVTVSTPTTSLLDGAASGVSVAQGDGVFFWSDGTNYFSSGIGVKHP